MIPIPNLKQSAIQIFKQTLSAIDIPSVLTRKLDRTGARILVNGAPVNLGAYERIYAVAIGKASVAMARGLTELLLPDFPVQGVLAAPVQTATVPSGFQAMVAAHPIPDAGSFHAARAILDLLSTANEHTLVFFLLSGGGSALVELPLDISGDSRRDPDLHTISLEDIQALNRELVTCGATIDEINTVRKHLSAVKGGRMALAAGAAMKITLAVTDVPVGQESALASGPTVPDPTTVADANAVLRRYELLSKLPPNIRMRFKHQEKIPETPKPGNPAFAPERSQFQIVLGLRDLFHTAHHAAECEGFVAECDNATDNWPLDRATDFLLAQLAAFKTSNPDKSVALIADGEVSSPVTGKGVGGRNMAFVLDCVKKIAGKEIAVLSAGTDGIDGSSPAAGAVADGETLARAQSLGLDPDDFFRRSDSYTFFGNLGDTIETGPTGNNLRDLRILLAR